MTSRFEEKKVNSNSGQKLVHIPKLTMLALNGHYEPLQQLALKMRTGCVISIVLQTSLYYGFGIRCYFQPTITRNWHWFLQLCFQDLYFFN